MVSIYMNVNGKTPLYSMDWHNMNCCVTCLTIYKIVSGLEGVTSQLQKKTQDILEALRVIEDVKFVYKVERLNSI